MQVFIRLIVCAVMTVLGSTAQTALADTVLITGANSGIGLEFARQYAADGWDVIATHRRSSLPDSLARLSAEYDNVTVEKIDVTDMSTISATVKKLNGNPIDVLINNAGIVGELRDPGQQFGSLDFDALQSYIDVNVLGPLRVSQAFYDNVVASKQKKIVAISSRAGSIGILQRTITGEGMRPPVRYWYDTSKAALNITFVALAKDAYDDGVSVAVYDPGLVLVERTSKYGVPEHLYTPVEEAVAGLREQFAALSLARTGQFYRVNGEPTPW